MRLAAASGIDGRKLSRERLALCGIGCTVVSRGAHDAYARTENNDTSEEQKRFAFGRRWHGDKIASPITN